MREYDTLAALSPEMQRLVSALRDTLEMAGLLHENARLLVAVSGGADSVALLCAACRLAPSAGFDVSACYVQHGLRGESSQADERFVRALCERLRVPLYVERARLWGGMDDPGAETRARAERRRIFDERMRALEADALLMAHHLNDQAETALMRLLRGAGGAGLCAMRAIAPFSCGVLLRPFLSLPKQTLLDALDAEGISHREDESNQSATTPRNALRLELLPELDRLFPGAARHIAAAAEALQADEDCLTSQADALYRRALLDKPPIFALSKAVLGAGEANAPDEAPPQPPEALLRRALRRWYQDALTLCGQAPDERSLSHEDTLRLVALLHAPRGESLNLPCDMRVLAGGRYLHLTRQDGAPLGAYAPQAPVRITREQALYRAGGITLRLSPCPPDVSPPTDARAVWLPPAMLDAGLWLRAPMPGDRVRPLGASGHKPLRRYLTDQRVDPPFRATLPVLACDGDVLWLPGLCTAEKLRAKKPEAGTLQMIVEGDIPYVP